MMIGGDDGIMMTNDDCTNCKRCAVKMGYWSDDYIDLFTRGSPRIERKTPEINRGYFVRVFAVHQVIEQFLDHVNRAGQQCQIVDLGCGFDTLFWRLHGGKNFKCIRSFVDLDLSGTTSRKVMHIRHKNSSIPTLFLSECVLIYMDVKDSNNILSWISSHFNHTVFINYEQVEIFDRFGQIMVENLRQRACELLDLESCRSLDTQKSRFMNSGWENVKAWDMHHIYRYKVPEEEIRRVEKIEFFDEANLLEQLLKHYCLVVASKGLPDLRIGFCED
ncbi:leucine carboxyl methyltransferase 1 [Brevipalpus obovatus]|uniref:leucine carboxyl methyltransferase 1 n=1 Tax=Brevipalpus obovatus TaxID=246614 RepID=UPI003D9DC763